jgi:hypothetical protein
MATLSKKRAGELVRQICGTLASYPEGLQSRALFDQLEGRFQLGESEPGSLGLPHVLRLGDVAVEASRPQIKAGWLVFRNDHWSLTETGRDAHAHIIDPEAFMDAAARRSVKGWLAVKFPRVYSAGYRAKYQANVELRLLRQHGLGRLIGRREQNAGGQQISWQDILPVQPLQEISVPGLQLLAEEALSDYLSSNRIPYTDCGRVIYLPAASVKASPFQSAMPRYPRELGLLITRNSRDLRHVGQRSETTAADDADRNHLALMANLLFSKGLGPRVYNLMEIQCGERSFTACAIERTNPAPLADSDLAAGMNEIRNMERQGLIRCAAATDGEQIGDVVSGCRAMGDEAGRFQWMAIQDLTLGDYDIFLSSVVAEAAGESHWGDKSVFRGWQYLYQSVPGVRLPGKRSTDDRIVALNQLMATAEVSVEKKVVLDIGCNLGMMMAQYLKIGADWCHGWDRASVAGHAEKLLLALGCTRFSVTGGDIDGAHHIEEDLPDLLKSSLEGCVISYLAVRGPLGWIDSLRTIPWSFMIYEGHEEEGEEDFNRHMSQLRRLVSFEIAAETSYQDGDCTERKVAILKRA